QRVEYQRRAGCVSSKCRPRSAGCCGSCESTTCSPSRGSDYRPRSDDGTVIPQTVNTLWGTDLTTTITGEGWAAVFIAVDHCSAECVGIHAAQRATQLRSARTDPPEPVPRRGSLPKSFSKRVSFHLCRIAIKS